MTGTNPPLQELKIDQIWRHYNSNEYKILHFANHFITPKADPYIINLNIRLIDDVTYDSIIIQNIETEKVFIFPIKDFEKDFTRVFL